MISEIMYIHNGSIRELEVTHYPAGEPCIKSIDALPKYITLRPKSLETFTTAMFWVDALRERGYKDEITLYIPYIPGGRQDRINLQGDTLFTLKSVANMINQRNFKTVVTLDPHSFVTNALIDRLIVIDPSWVVWKNLRDSRYDGIIAPDAGAQKRAEAVAKILNIPVVIQGWKSRDVSTGKISGFGLQAPPSNARHFLVVDDICDGGGTFLGLAEKISDYGLTADLYVSHGIFSHGPQMLLDKYERIYTTDSIIPKQYALAPDQEQRFIVWKEFI